MNRKNLITKTVLILLMILFACCSQAPEKQTPDEFFEPLKITPGKKQKAVSSEIDSLKIEVMKLLNTQRKRISEIEYLLSSYNSTRPSVSSQYPGSDNNIFTTSVISNDSLFMIVHSHNSRLSEIVGAIKSVKKNWEKEKTDMRALVAELKQKLRQKEETYLDVDSIYSIGISLYKKQKYVEAIDVFKKAIKSNVSPQLQDNCYFWIGVCHFKQNRIRYAMVEFSKILDMEDSDKRESSFFMLGQCYERLNRKKEAISVFKKLLVEYPDGDLRQITETKIALLR